MVTLFAALPSVLSLGLAWAQPEPWPPPLPPPPDPPPEVNPEPAVEPAPAPPTPLPARPPVPPQPFPTYILRLHLGLGWIMPSDQSRMLHKDGFGMGLRGQAIADMTMVVDKWFGVGAWGGVAGWGWRGDFGEKQVDESASQPTLFQRVFYAGGQVPIYLKSERPIIALTPRLGLATGRLFLHGAGAYRSTWTAGFDLSFMAHLSSGVLLGTSLGALWAPVAATHEAPLHYDMGGFMLSFVGGFGG